ncbi:MAG: Ku protein [Candidatus Dormiibacterota bacterium]
MPRSMWRGAISFGMVAIPVRLYLATESKSVSFRLLCPNDQTPVRNKRWCPEEDREIGWSDALRGYEVGKDEYVIITDSDLDDLPLTTTHTIDIIEFCPDSEIEAGVYLKSAYYLEPEAVGAKPYALLRQALEKTGKVAIGKIALRDREHLCRLALHEQGLLLNTLHWPDEIRSAGELAIPDENLDVKKAELDMAVMLIENLSAHFDPERHHDAYREALLEVVEAKLNNQPLERHEAPEPGKVTDLMAALKASVEAAKSRKSDETADGETAEPARRQRAS